MRRQHNTIAATLLSLLLIASSLFAVTAQAAMVSTSSAVTQQFEQYDRDKLLDALSQNGVRDQLLAMGVNPELVEERIQTLTPTELAQLNDQIGGMPAGQSSVVGVLLVVFIVFIVTDMLCATDIFSFVKCVNR